MKRLVAAILIYVVLAAGLVVLVATEAGLQWAWARAEAHLPGNIRLDSIQGRLLGPVRVEGLEYHDEEMRLQIRQLEWDWLPSSLWFGVADIAWLKLEGMHYTALISDDSLPSFPGDWSSRYSLRVRQAEITDLRYQGASGDEPIVLEHASFTARTGLSGLQLEDIHLQSGQAQLRATANLRLRGDYPLKASLSADGKDAKGADWQAGAELKGSLRKLKWSVSLSKPQQAQATGSFRWTDEYMELDAELGTQALADWAQWQGMEDPGLTSLQGKILARYTGPRLQVLNAELQSPGTPSKLTLKAELDSSTAGNESVLQLNWQALRWPLQGKPQVSSAYGEAQLRGKLPDYQIDAKASFNRDALPPLALAIQGQGDLGRVEIQALQARMDEATIQGKGAVDWAETRTAAFTFNGRDVDPGVIDPEWPGRLTLNGELAAQWPDTGLRVAVKALAVQGQLRGQALKLQARGSWVADNVQIDEAELRSGGTRLTARGRYGTQHDLHADINSPDLASLLPQAMGQVEGRLRLQGTTQRPQLQVSLKASDLAYQEVRVGRLQLEATSDAREGQASQLDLQCHEGTLSGIALKSLRLEIQGPDAQQEAGLRIVSDLGDITMQASGQRTGLLEWDGRITGSEWRPPKGETWKLIAPAGLRLSRERMVVDRPCWSAGQARACVAAQWLGGHLAASTEVRGLPLETLQVLLPPELALTGLVDADGEFESTQAGETSGHADIRLAAADILRTQPTGHAQLVRLRPSTAELRLAGNAVDFGGDLQLAPLGQVSFKLRLPWPLSDNTDDTPLEGSVRADLPDLTFVSALLPELNDVRGHVQGNMRLSGSIGEPRSEGRLQLSDGTARIERLGLRIQALNAQLQSRGGDELAIEASGQSGDGTFRIQATTQGPARIDQATINATLQGSDFLAYNTPDARIHLSPDLKLRMSGRNFQLRGDIKVPRADITPRKFARTGAVTASADQVLVGEANAEDGLLSTWAIRSRIRLLLGDAVRFDGMGLTARLEGELQIKDEPGELTTASGELRVAEGEYAAYGQQLDITTGRLLFTGGPISDPAVDARAERKAVDGVRVGIQLRGPLKSPQASLFSEPPMPDSDRLSYLMFGTPLGSGEGARNQAITRAAYALGLSGGEALVEQIGVTLGADEVQIQSGTGDNLSGTALVIGKYLSPRLYISYGIGLFEAVRTLRLRYRISDRWTIETESGTHSGGDLLYSIER